MPRVIKHATQYDRLKIKCPTTFDLFYCEDGKYIQIATDLLSAQMAKEAMEELQANPEFMNRDIFAVSVTRNVHFLNFNTALRSVA